MKRSLVILIFTCIVLPSFCQFRDESPRKIKGKTFKYAGSHPLIYTIQTSDTTGYDHDSLWYYYRNIGLFKKKSKYIAMTESGVIVAKGKYKTITCYRTNGLHSNTNMNYGIWKYYNDDGELLYKSKRIQLWSLPKNNQECKPKF